MITDRDREIINFIEIVGFATIEQIGRIFYQGTKNQYDLARKRLKKIYEQGDYLKSSRCKETNQVIYAIKDKSSLRATKHNILMLDYLSKLMELGANMEKIEITKEFGGVIPDALIQFVWDGYRYYQILEVQLRHDKVDVNRLERALPKILDITGGVVPAVIVIQDTSLDYEKDNLTHFKVLKISTDLKNLARVFV